MDRKCDQEQETTTGQFTNLLFRRCCHRTYDSNHDSRGKRQQYFGQLEKKTESRPTEPTASTKAASPPPPVAVRGRDIFPFPPATAGREGSRESTNAIFGK